MDALFDDAEPTEPLARVQRSDSTAETRERYAFLKTKKLGAVWEEAAGRLYRMAGVTVFDPNRWGA